MAKRKKGGRKRRRAAKKVVVVAKPSRKRSRKGGKRGRRSITLSKVSGKVYTAKRGGFRRARRSGSLWHGNPMGGLIRIPSQQELVAVAVGALALPAVSMLVKKLPLPDLMKSGWGGVATELLIGSAASVAVRKFVGQGAGDVIFVLTLANGIQKSVRALAPAIADQIGLADEAPEGVEYYDPGQMGYVDPSQTGALGADFPEMV